MIYRMIFVSEPGKAPGWFLVLFCEKVGGLILTWRVPIFILENSVNGILIKYGFSDPLVVSFVSVLKDKVLICHFDAHDKHESKLLFVIC